MGIEVQENDLESGDVFCSGSGDHVGTLEVDGFNKTERALHLQVYVGDGNWYVYQLVAIEKLGEENVSSIAPTER